MSRFILVAGVVSICAAIFLQMAPEPEKAFPEKGVCISPRGSEYIDRVKYTSHDNFSRPLLYVESVTSPHNNAMEGVEFSLTKQEFQSYGIVPCPAER